jgi:hypothetical protein
MEHIAKEEYGIARIRLTVDPVTTLQCKLYALKIDACPISRKGVINPIHFVQSLTTTNL